jgi:hypothetical protein
VPKRHLTHLLEAFVEDIPDTVWLTDLTYVSLLGQMRSAASQNLLVRGHATGQNMVAEQDLANQFREKLSQDARFDALYACGTPRMQSTLDGSGGRTLSPEQLAQQLETRSSFEFECTPRKR